MSERSSESHTRIEQRAEACEVKPEHLVSLEPIHKLLRAMNDPFEAAERIAPLVEGIPVLVARCERRFLRKSPYGEWRSTEHLLSLIGNRGLESELLTLLEDLSELKEDLQDAADAENAS